MSSLYQRILLLFCFRLPEQTNTPCVLPLFFIFLLPREFISPCETVLRKLPSSTIHENVSKPDPSSGAHMGNQMLPSILVASSSCLKNVCRSFSTVWNYSHGWAEKKAVRQRMSPGFHSVSPHLSRLRCTGQAQLTEMSFFFFVVLYKLLLLMLFFVVMLRNNLVTFGVFSGLSMLSDALTIYKCLETDLPANVVRLVHLWIFFSRRLDNNSLLMFLSIVSFAWGQKQFPFLCTKEELPANKNATRWMAEMGERQRDVASVFVADWVWLLWMSHCAWGVWSRVITSTKEAEEVLFLNSVHLFWSLLPIIMTKSPPQGNI